MTEETKRAVRIIHQEKVDIMHHVVESYKKASNIAENVEDNIDFMYLFTRPMANALNDKFKDLIKMMGDSPLMGYQLKLAESEFKVLRTSLSIATDSVKKGKGIDHVIDRIFALGCKISIDITEGSIEVMSRSEKEEIYNLLSPYEDIIAAKKGSYKCRVGTLYRKCNMDKTWDGLKFMHDKDIR